MIKQCLNSVRAVSTAQSFEEIVEDALRQLGKATTTQLLEKVKANDPTASEHRVRKVLEGAGFAEVGVGEVTVHRKDCAPYRRQIQMWVHKDQRQVPNAPDDKVVSIEVVIQPRRPRTHFGVIEEIEHQSPEVIVYQALEVTVKNVPVKKLQVKVLFDDGGVRFDRKYAFYLNWGKIRYLDFLANETEKIDFWTAYKIGGVEKILLNVWPTPVSLQLTEFYSRNDSHIDVIIQFIGEGLNDQPRNYRLNAQSWDRLCLTESS